MEKLHLGWNGLLYAQLLWHSDQSMPVYFGICAHHYMLEACYLMDYFVSWDLILLHKQA